MWAVLRIHTSGEVEAVRWAEGTLGCDEEALRLGDHFRVVGSKGLQSITGCGLPGRGVTLPSSAAIRGLGKAGCGGLGWGPRP